MCFSVEEGFPTIKGDGCHRNIISQYKDSFKGAWSQAAQLMDKVTQQQQQLLVIIISTEHYMAEIFN